MPVNQEEWYADFAARCAQGQLGWGQSIKGRVRSWDLTEHNSKAFDDDPDVFPIFNCPTCNGHGFVGPATGGVIDAETAKRIAETLGQGGCVVPTRTDSDDHN